MKTDSERNLELLRRAQDGDIDAFAELFEQQRKFVFMIAWRLAGENDCDDVVMETFLKAWKALPRFRRRASLKTWLARIAHNCALDFRRSAGRRAAGQMTIVDDEGGSGLERLADPRLSNPASEAASEDMKKIIAMAMEKLSEEQRTAVMMREVDGLSYREIAAAANVGIGTVMSRLFYGKKRLRELLREYI